MEFLINNRSIIDFFYNDITDMFLGDVVLLEPEVVYLGNKDFRVSLSQ